jgi:ABC-2 type transport system ATP-binding protein
MIKAGNLVKEFDNKRVINSISFKIKKGEICGYLGPNGAGKTTTVKLILGLIEPTGGEIFINDLDVRKHSQTIRSFVGYVPESGFLYEPLSPIELLTFVGRMHGIEDNLIKKRIDLFAELLDLKNVLDQPISTFSKGMKQKALIIAALIHLPDIIILDEPLNGLDATSMLLFKELINTLAKQNKTVFYCSHLLDVVEKMCDSIIILNKGEIIESGSVQEVKEKGNNRSLELIYNDLTGAEDYKVRVEKFIENIGS